MGKRKCTHTFVGHQCDGDRVVSIMCAVAGCNERLSLGPSNDGDVPADEIIAAVCAHSDADHEAFEVTDDIDWNPKRPLAEQWPWNGHPTREAYEAHMARGDAMLEETLTGAARLEAAICAMASDAAEEHISLTGPTDKGQPVAPLTFSVQSTRCTTCGHQHGGPEVAFICIGCPCPEQSVSGPITSGSPDAFEPVDYAATQPWADPSTTTRLTDDELVKTIAYAPPGSVLRERDAETSLERLAKLTAELASCPDAHGGSDL